VTGSIGGMAIALVVWLVTAKAIGGTITVETLSDQWVSFAGNTAAIVSGGALSIGLSLWRPANFDWEITRQMATVDESDSRLSDQCVNVLEGSIVVSDDKKDSSENTVHPDTQKNGESMTTVDGLDLVSLQRTYRFYGYLFAVLALIITIVCCLNFSCDATTRLMSLNIRSYLSYCGPHHTFFLVVFRWSGWHQYCKLL
jgi:hypothetical protein